MPSDVRVYVVDLGRKSLYLQYTNPQTGAKVRRSAKTDSKRTAERAAAVWEAEINDGRWSQTAGQVTWERVREEYEQFHLSGLAPKSVAKSIGLIAEFSRRMKPATIGDIDAPLLSRFVAVMRSTSIVSTGGRKLDRKRSETTIRGYVVAVRAILNWAKRQGYVAAMPEIPRIQRARKTGSGRVMKGRATTDEELAKMIAAVPSIQVTGFVVANNPKRIAEVQRFLMLLRLSGLRLEEAVDCWWDRPDRLHVVIGRDGRPYLSLHAGQQKSQQDDLLPVTPELGTWLLATPLNQRTGRVAPVATKYGNVNPTLICRIITACGKAAGVVVNHQSGKYASAQDIRRQFATDCLRRFPPAVARTLCRHQDIATTMSYYEDLRPEAISDQVWGNVTVPESSLGAFLGATPS